MKDTIEVLRNDMIALKNDLFTKKEDEIFCLCKKYKEELEMIWEKEKGDIFPIHTDILYKREEYYANDAFYVKCISCFEECLETLSNKQEIHNLLNRIIVHLQFID